MIRLPPKCTHAKECCLLFVGLQQCQIFPVLSPITSSPSGSRSLIPWHETIAVPSHVHLSVDLPEQIFSLTSKGSSALHHIPHVRLNHFSAMFTVRNSSKTGTVLLRNSNITLLTFRSPVASSAAARLKLMLFGFLLLSFSRSLIK